MLNALTYLTRRCPRQCSYCALRDAKGVGPELSPGKWSEAFDVLYESAVEFNLVLGNETWLLGNNLIPIFKKNRVPYALYTTCPEPLFSRNRGTLLRSGVIDNLSCGVDWPRMDVPVDDDSWRKSQDAWRGFEWLRSVDATMDCQGTVTIHRHNYKYLPKIIEQLGALNVFCGVNFIHWDKDGGYDFFPDANSLSEYLFRDEDLPQLRRVLDECAENPGRLQNPEMLVEDTVPLTSMGWHCNGDPYGGPTIDADGTLRCCGYRKGVYTPKFHIFDLPAQWNDWQQAVRKDAMECPGCFWSYPWMFHYWRRKDSGHGKKVFTQHAGKHIPEEQWSKRRL